MPTSKNPTGNWVFHGGGDPNICNSCGRPYNAWPGDNCQFKFFHLPFEKARKSAPQSEEPVSRKFESRGIEKERERIQEILDNTQPKCASCGKRENESTKLWNCNGCGHVYCVKHIDLKEHHCQSLPPITKRAPAPSPAVPPIVEAPAPSQKSRLGFGDLNTGMLPGVTFTGISCAFWGCFNNATYECNTCKSIFCSEHASTSAHSCGEAQRFGNERAISPPKLGEGKKNETRIGKQEEGWEKDHVESSDGDKPGSNPQGRDKEVPKGAGLLHTRIKNILGEEWADFYSQEAWNPVDAICPRCYSPVRVAPDTDLLCQRCDLHLLFEEADFFARLSIDCARLGWAYRKGYGKQYGPRFDGLDKRLEFAFDARLTSLAGLVIISLLRRLSREQFGNLVKAALVKEARNEAIILTQIGEEWVDEFYSHVSEYYQWRLSNATNQTKEKELRRQMSW